MRIAQLWMVNQPFPSHPFRLAAEKRDFGLVDSAGISGLGRFGSSGSDYDSACLV